MLSTMPPETDVKADTAELEKAIVLVESYLSSMEPAFYSAGNGQLERVLIDAFTPGDIKASKSTTLKGRLRKGLG